MLQNKIYQNYIIEILKTFITILLSLSIIAWTVRAVNFLDLIVENGYSIIVYFQYSLLNLFGIVTKFIPLSFLIALVIFIIKQIQENELIILWTSGVKKIQLVHLFFLSSIFVSLFYLIFSVFISPAALNKSRQLLSNENLSSTGTINSGTGSTIGNLTLANGSITDSSGAISFGNENLTTTGTLAVGNVTLSSGSIVDSSGAISFGNENLTSTGTINSGTGSTIGNLTLSNGSITDSGGAISFGNENLTTTGSVTSGTLTLAGASITDSSGEIDFGNENLTTTGTLNVSGLSTLGALTVTGATTFGGGGITIDNLILNDNTISSSSNADINLTPGGTGIVKMSNLTVDSNINITDNTIKTTVSNSDLQLSGGSGSGIVEIIPGLVTAAVTTVGNVDVTGTETITGQLDVDAVRIKDNTITTNASNANLEISANGSGKVIMTAPDIIGGTINNTVIGGSTPAAGTFTTLSTTESLTIDGITISDNTISTNASNANLELTGSGSGGVRISGFTFPTSDGTAGKFITTNGLGVLSFATAGASLSHSDLADATTTISSSATSVLNTFDKTVYRSAKYFISASDATNSRFELLEANVIHDGTTAYLSTFGSVSDYTTGLGTYTVGISGDDVQLKVTNITDNSIVFKFQRIAIDV